MPKIPYDPDTTVVEEHFAVVYAPRKSRDRFSEGAVELKDSAEQACADADNGSNCFAAIVAGPSRSSEGLRLYYLVDWLDS
jgi:4-aminobutyrate aminotransferase-like enzyme